MKGMSAAIVAALLVVGTTGAAQAQLRPTLGALYPLDPGKVSARLSALPHKQSPQITVKCRSAACLIRHPNGSFTPNRVPR